MKLTGGDIMSNIINWFQTDRLYRILEMVNGKKQDYYAGKLSPEEEAEMIAFLALYFEEPEEQE